MADGAGVKILIGQLVAISAGSAKIDLSHGDQVNADLHFKKLRLQTAPFMANSAGQSFLCMEDVIKDNFAGSLAGVNDLHAARHRIYSSCAEGERE